jgi:alkyl sulfatase BDS1-like metallo-beta-lactamase superfamily hydrolase
VLRRPVHLGLAQRRQPQKVQRYPLEWADALRRMLALYDSPGGGPEVLLPGHGYPVIGADRVRQALTDTAELLESLVEQTLALMNSGVPGSTR